MNIADKQTLFCEIRRLVGRGGRFAIYDILRVGAGDLKFPVPWATDASTSFVETVATYRAELEAAGFTVVHERDRGEFAAEFFAAMATRAGAQPPLGLHVIMGQDAPTKMRNMVAAVTAGVVAPIELVCEAD